MAERRAGPVDEKASARYRLGFRDGERGTHSSRTIMLAELSSLLAATSPETSVPEFRRITVDQNLLGKRTATTREHTIRKLKALYGLAPTIPVYRVMRTLWDDDPEGRPLLALMCAVARDPLLRASVQVVIDTPLGEALGSTAFAASVRPEFSASTRDAIVSHLISSWSVAGFLAAASRTRTRARATAGAAAYALALGFMEGRRGSLLLSTMWIRLLDCPPDDVMNLVRQAARRRWVEYRAAGDVMDLRVDAWFTEQEKGWCDGQPG